MKKKHKARVVTRGGAERGDVGNTERIKVTSLLCILRVVPTWKAIWLCRYRTLPPSLLTWT